MSSQLKSDTARTNGAKSRGPKSAETRAISSQNSLRHGFTACNTTLLKCENPDEFEDSIAHHFSTYHPADDEQEALVNEMISARWRIRRLRVVETALLDIEMMRNQAEMEKKYAQPDGAIRLTEAMRALMEEEHLLTLVSRYESRLFRMHDCAYRTLRQLQKVRHPGPQGIEPAAPVEPAGITLVPAPAESPSENNQTNPPGSDSSSRETPQAHGSTRRAQSPFSSRSSLAVTGLFMGKRLRRR
jgi:hypothetical protein